MTQYPSPRGIDFFDYLSRRHVRLITEGPLKGWLAYAQSDGQWATLREATKHDHIKANQC